MSFLYQPDDKLSVFAMADMGKEGGTGYPGANIWSAACGSADPETCPDSPGLAPEDLDLRNVVYRGAQGTLDSTNWGAMANVSYDFGPIVAEYNTSYRDVDYRQTNAASEGILWPGRDVSPRGPGTQFFLFGCNINQIPIQLFMLIEILNHTIKFVFEVLVDFHIIFKYHQIISIRT